MSQLSQGELQEVLQFLRTRLAPDELQYRNSVNLRGLPQPIRYAKRNSNLDLLSRLNFRRRSDPTFKQFEEQQKSNFHRSQRFSNLNTRHMLGGL